MSSNKKPSAEDLAKLGFTFGPCCCCERTEEDGAFVRNIIQIHKKAPILGTGWGCFQCGLPLDGAVAVMCDECLEAEAPLRFACFGYPKDQKRIPIDQLAGQHDHDESRHPELRQRCRVCGCTELKACFDAKLGPCWWHEPNLCSHCAIKAGLDVTRPDRPLTAG